MVLSEEERKKQRIANRKWRKNNPEDVKKARKKSYQKNREKILLKLKERYKNPKYIKKANKRRRERYKNDPEYRERNNASNRRSKEKRMWLVKVFLYPYKCYICNRKYDRVALDLHHINPKIKSFAIGDNSSLVNSQPLKLIEEILKCIVVCKNCHALIENKKIKLGEIKNRLI